MTAQWCSLCSLQSRSSRLRGVYDGYDECNICVGFVQSGNWIRIGLRQAQVSTAMEATNIALLLISVGVFIYLLFALIFPEKF